MSMRKCKCKYPRARVPAGGRRCPRVPTCAESRTSACEHGIPSPVPSTLTRTSFRPSEL